MAGPQPHMPVYAAAPLSAPAGEEGKGENEHKMGVAFLAGTSIILKVTTPRCGSVW